MAGMVNGLDIQTSMTEIGIFALNMMANAAARTICEGIGMNAQNRPIAAARETE